MLDTSLLEAHPEMLWDLLDPEVVLFELPAIAKVARSLGLTRPESEECLHTVRSLLADDARETPDVTSAFGRITIHGRRAQWTLRSRDLVCVSTTPHMRPTVPIEDAYPEPAGHHATAPLRDPSPATATEIQPEASSREQVSDVSLPVLNYAAAPTSDAQTVPQGPPPIPGSDLVTQIERLAALRERGLLTESEFAAAKAKLLR